MMERMLAEKLEHMKEMTLVDEMVDRMVVRRVLKLVGKMDEKKVWLLVV
jgi:hypothetical protein